MSDVIVPGDFVKINIYAGGYYGWVMPSFTSACVKSAHLRLDDIAFVIAVLNDGMPVTPWLFLLLQSSSYAWFPKRYFEKCKW